MKRQPEPDEWAEIRLAIARALEEDLQNGDVTTAATVPPGTVAAARIVSRDHVVVCGGPIAAEVFTQVSSSIEVDLEVADGQHVGPDTVLMVVKGDAAGLLMAERTALNLLQRGCGVATLTGRYVDETGSRTKILDTRKTMPGLRALDRYAVRCGGGHNHRYNLGRGVLIKENHIRVAGGVAEAVLRVRESGTSLEIECEVQTLDELTQAIDAGAEMALLDNMDDASVVEAVRVADGRIVLEASGGITLERVASLAALGVDRISVGGLTHSAPATDISMLFDA